MENFNVTVKRTWTFVRKLPAKSRFTNCSDSAIEWLLVSSGTPSVRFGHRLDGGLGVLDAGEGLLFAKVSESNQVIPMSCNLICSYDKGAEVQFSSLTPVPDETYTEGATINSWDFSQYFQGDYTPFTYSVPVGTLPAGLSLNASTGVLTGTVTTVAPKTGIVVRVTDDEGNTADTNPFNITVIEDT